MKQMKNKTNKTNKQQNSDIDCHHQYMTTTKNIFVPQTFFFHKKQNEKKMVNEPESHIGHTKKRGINSVA